MLCNSLDLRLDPTSRRVWRGEREIELSKTEFDLLELLLRNQGIVLDHSTIYDRIWGYDFGPDSKNLAVYISYLRRKLETARRVEVDPHRSRRGVLGSVVVSLRLKIVARAGAAGDVRDRGCRLLVVRQHPARAERGRRPIAA